MVGISLFGANLEGADLRGADLYRSDLRGINLRKANLEAANLAEADIRDGRLFVQSENGSYEPVGDGVSRIDDAVLARANLQSARLGNAIGPRTDLSGANLRHANLVNANLSESDLSGVDFSGANLSGANLGGCVLHGAVLLGATMDGTNFSDADLTASLFMKSEMDPDQLRDAVVAPSLAEVGGTIADILREHSVWVRSLGSEGSQADMSGIDLTGLSLRGVDTKTLRSRLILMFPCRAI
ncbi:MAG: pentapeptide repeat-containing protein, partial [Alphaproteobacteria bacterium]|nr:pentapeptide repeat-containing protein [Alphaproteobacteria bacterium]